MGEKRNKQTTFVKNVTLDEFDRVKVIYQLGIAQMHRDGIFQWDNTYPGDDLLANDLKANTMFGFYFDKHLAGVMVLNNEQEPSYQSINWKLDTTNPLVIHRICIDPLYSHRGIGLQLMQYAIEYATDNAYLSVRLDTFVGNYKAQAIFAKMGFIKHGKIAFRNREFFCFEMVF